MAVYLDNAATTCVCGEAAAASLRIMTECYANPSSLHTMGRTAKDELENARSNIASALGGARPSEIIFTSGGTESDNLAILSGAKLMGRKGRHIISSRAEHEAVLNCLTFLESSGWEITRLSPGPGGAIDTTQVAGALRPDTVLVSLMLVNNETGSVTDIAAISKLLKRSGSLALLHTDAVQGFLKLPFTVKSLGADLISLSAHKIHGPKGIGALYIRNGLKLSPLIFGGGQEGGLRSGTEGLPQIAAFGVSAGIASKLLPKASAHMSAMRESAACRLKSEIPDLVIIGGGAPHILCISLPGYQGEVLMNFLESREIFVSKSSACKKGGRSHVLEAMGLKDEIIDGAIRIGISRFTTESEINMLCDCLKEASEKLVTRRRSK